MAHQVMVEPGEGAELVLSLVRADGSRLSLLLGTGEVVALRPIFWRLHGAWRAPTGRARGIRDEPSQAMLNAGEATRAYFDAQNMGAWHKLIPWDKPGNMTSAGIPLQRPLSEDKMLRLGALAARHGLTPSDTGGGTISLMNFGKGPASGKDMAKALLKGDLGKGIADILPDAGTPRCAGLR